ncbi:indolepyruvate ferredoxin oxidoreductase family protein [Spongiibacter sp. KMU-158]|uniref:Indolepyruvate ferredoxin oxidoreductase family protein n=1 Tax=Spongiibacter pelagi TaxID=2760804 RepID=A0A927C588_9GAMM|nr:indolepyruvate ferredoxin oxidoreductase family protein [Spongiibacter pelagi]MBD2859811.1 indolepyruvate ferredoxin oxidoreductase family protein [Spongiibacter pelagi]
MASHPSNQQAFLHRVSLDDKYALDTTRAYLTGIEALVRLPILQHQRDLERGLNTAGFVSGYRGSPLGGLDQALWEAGKYLDKHNIRFQPGINEDLAATAVRGTQELGLFPGAKYDGVFGMWYGKGPGVDRSMDVIKHANAVGTAKYGGVLAVAGDDHAAKSSSLPHQSEHMFIGASIPVLAPANVQEVLDLGVFGWELSRYSGCWVGLKAITENMDSAISAEIDPHRINIVIPDSFVMPADGVHVRLPDSPLEQEKRLNKYKIYAARAFALANRLNYIAIDSAKPRLGIATSGKAYLDVLQALEDLGIDEQLAGEIGLRVYKIGMPWPLEPVATHAFAEGLEEILVVEEKRSVIEDQLTGQLYNWPVEKRPRVIGEFDEHGRDLLPNLSELTPAMVARAIAARIRRFYQSEEIEKRLRFYDKKELSLVSHRNKIARIPHYCSGCPHNTSTQVPEGSFALGGIGCHYMSTFMASRPAKTFTQMGGEGVTWVGQAPFTENKHVFQNLGDGTYFHSGLLAIRQAIAAGVNITYKILYNDAVAMTGGQPIDGSLSVEQMIQQLRGEGVQRIALVSDHPEKFHFSHTAGLTIDHRDNLMAIQKSLRETEGTTVLLYEQTCAAEKRRRRKRGLLEDPQRRIFINEAVCEGCGDCGKKSNCLSVLPLETALGRKRQIDQNACNKDYSCVNGFCPSFVSVNGGRLRKNRRAEAVTEFAPLPKPAHPELDQPWNIVVTGVGGTGVLTITAVLAMAAHIEGKGCATMNQTGLAQKFGPVVSHLRIAKKQSDIKAVRIAAGDADLLLGGDLVVSVSDEALAKLNAERSAAVINTTQTATAEFVYKPDADFPADAMRDILTDEIGAEKVHFVSATDTAKNLLGDAVASNFFMLGYAYQLGMIPVSAEAIAAAIEMNNVAVEFNKQAFLWGRRMVVDANAVRQIAGLDKPEATIPQTLEEILIHRVELLTEYQDANYAARYLAVIERLRQCEQQLISADKSLPLSRVAAKSLAKLMAYKDEYEVARLYSNGNFLKQLNQVFEGDFKLQFHLAPPILSRRDPDSGELKKRTFGSWLMPVFKTLARFKKWRGSVWDVFGYSRERKMERALIAQFENDIDVVIEHLAPSNLATAIALFELPEQLRGFGHIKLAAFAEYEQQRAQLFSEFLKPPAQFIEIKHVA